MKKKILIAIGLGFFLVFAFFWSNRTPFVEKTEAHKKEKAPTVEVNESVSKTVALVEVEETFKKAESFIRERLPVSDDILKFDLGDHTDPTQEELIEELFNYFYIVLKERDIDLATVVFSGNSIQEVMGNELNPDKRIAKLEQALDKLSRNSSLVSLSYQLYKDKEDNLTGEATVDLEYQDDLRITIPVSIQAIGEDDHRFYQLITTIKELENDISSKEKE